MVSATSSGVIREHLRASNTLKSKLLPRGLFTLQYFPKTSFLLVRSLSLNRAVVIDVTGTHNLGHITYIVLARGKLILSSTLSAVNSKVVSFKFLPPIECIPRARLLVFYISKSGEIISDSIDLEFGDDLRNFVSLTFFLISQNKSFQLNLIQVELQAPEQTKPSEIVNLTVKSQPNSLVGLLGVDQSVMLLKGGNDIEKSDVSNELLLYNSVDRYNFEWTEDSYYASYTDFWHSNALIMTNAKPEYGE